MKKFYKSNKNKKILGICGGIGEYFNIDPNIIRIGVAFFSGICDGISALILYFIIGFLLPKDEIEYLN